MVSIAGPAMMIGLMNSAENTFLASLMEAVSTTPLMGVGVGVGAGVGVGVGVTGQGVGEHGLGEQVGVQVGTGVEVAAGVGVGGNIPATMRPR